MELRLKGGSLFET